jgi:hypothetical protein
MYCGKRSHWAGICRKRNSDSNSGRSKSSDNGRRPTGRTKPKKTEYKKAKERGKSYTDKNNKKIDGNASKGARSSQQKRSNVNMVHLVEEEEDSAAPSCNSIEVIRVRLIRSFRFTSNLSNPFDPFVVFPCLSPQSSFGQ